jgi:membrane protein DedA with SNARE-associated domain
VHDVQQTLAAYGYAALLPLAVFEGPVATVVAAFLAAQGTFEVGIVYGVVVLGDLIGDMLYYAIGRWPLRCLGTFSGKRAARLHQRIALLAPRIRERAGVMLLLGKLTHSAGFAVLLAAGAAHVPIRRFLLFNILGTLPKSLLLVALGYWFGWLAGGMQGDLRIAGAAGFVLSCGMLALLTRWLCLTPRGRRA